MFSVFRLNRETDEGWRDDYFLTKPVQPVGTFRWWRLRSSTAASPTITPTWSHIQNKNSSGPCSKFRPMFSAAIQYFHRSAAWVNRTLQPVQPFYKCPCFALFFFFPHFLLVCNLNLSLQTEPQMLKGSEDFSAINSIIRVFANSFYRVIP